MIHSTACSTACSVHLGHGELAGGDGGDSGRRRGVVMVVMVVGEEMKYSGGCR